MQTTARQYVLASAALLATSMAIGAPFVAHQAQTPTRHADFQLVDADITGAEAIPFNLFADIVNIPGNEVEAINDFGTSLMSGGTWLVADATNLFGEDPGDPSRFMALVDIAIPFTSISGEGSPEPGFVDPSDPSASFNWADAASGQLGLSQQISLLLDAEIPVSASSDGTYSAPLDPVSPITGFDGIDRAIWSAEIFSYQTPFPLIDNWFTVPSSDLTNASDPYNFGTVVDPSEGTGTDGAVPSDDVWGFAGTHPEMGDMGYGVNAAGDTLNANGNVVQLMPWSNESFTFNPAYSFDNFFSSNPGGLEAPVDPSTFLSSLNIPTGEEIFQAFQSLVAGSIISFDPLVPGSPICDPVCTGLPNDLSMPALVQDVANWDPNNADINEWLKLYNTTTYGPGGLLNPYGATNDPTQENINFANITNGQGEFDLGNPQPSDPGPVSVETPTSFPVSQSVQELQQFFQSSGLLNLVQEYADSQGYTPIDFNNPDLFLQPTTSTATGAASEAAAANAFDPSSFTADLSSILGSTTAADLSQMLANELPQLLGAQLSTDVLSLF